MLIDTDVVIWAMRGHAGAIDALDGVAAPCLSIVTVIELMQGARDKPEMGAIESRLRRWGAEIIAGDVQMSDYARDLIREYAHACGLQLADALIAATAIVRELPLLSGNRKHYESIAELQFSAFRPQ